MADQSPISVQQESIAAMSALVSAMVVCLVENPSAVSIRAVTTGEITSLQVRVAPEDVGKVVGKQGRTARSLRTILSAISMKRKQKFALDIVEEG